MWPPHVISAPQLFFVLFYYLYCCQCKLQSKNREDLEARLACGMLTVRAFYSESILFFNTSIVLGSPYSYYNRIDASSFLTWSHTQTHPLTRKRVW